MRTRYVGILVILLLLFLCLFAGCNSEPEPTGYPYTYGDVTFELTPKRVVSLSPALTESLYTLGYGGRVVGVSNYCDRPTAADGLPSCGIAQSPDLEGIYALNPDLLLTSVELHADALATLAEMGIPVVTVGWAEDIDGVVQNQADLLLIFEGEIKGAERAAQVAYYADTMTAYICDSVGRYLAQPPAVVTDGDDEEAGGEEASGGAEAAVPSAIYMARMDFVLATGDTLMGQFLEGMGFVNQADPYTGWSYPPEDEPDLNPDYIFYSQDVDVTALVASDYYKLTRAVTSERVYEVDGLAFERQSIMMFDEMYRMARSAFPDAFERPVPQLTPPQPKPPEPEPKWYDFILDWFD